MIDLCQGINIKILKIQNKMFFRNLNGIRIEDQERTLSCVYNKRIWVGNNSMAFNNYDDYNENLKSLHDAKLLFKKNIRISLKNKVVG
jgi:hypothetical protein